MDIKRLRYFIQIVDSGSITRAAAAVGVAQPALSQQLAFLENEFKVKLIERSVSGIKPTEAGRTLYAGAQTILKQYEDVRLAVHRSARTLSGTVVVGVAPTMMKRFAIPLIERLCIQQPALRLQILEEGSAVLQELLLNGRAELVISPFSPESKNVLSEELLTERLVLLHSPQLEVPENASLAELALLPWVVTRAPNSVRSLIDAVFRAANLTPRVAVEIDSLPNGIEVVKRGVGVTVLPEGVVREDVDAGLLRQRQFSDRRVVRPVYLVYRHMPALSAAGIHVRDQLLEIATEHQLGASAS